MQMAELRASLGRPIISESSAHELGRVKDLAVDAEARSVNAVLVEGGGKGTLVDWSEVSAFGEDAVMVKRDDDAHEPRDDAQSRALDGDFAVLGKLVLSNRGNACGHVEDLEFNASTGQLEAVRTDSGSVDPARLVGIGTYAVIIEAAEDETVSGF
jgi:uncharacterized protein YrrD